MSSDYPILSPQDFDYKLMEQMQEMQRTVIFCTIVVAVSFIIIVPPLLYLYFRKLERNTTNLLNYYEKLEEGVPVKNKSSLV
jgi:hypothetical protein